MYPVSVITYVLNILDTFNTGVTSRFFIFIDDKCCLIVFMYQIFLPFFNIFIGKKYLHYLLGKINIYNELLSTIHIIAYFYFGFPVYS